MTPFALQDAVIYEYEIYRLLRRRDRTDSVEVAFNGLAMSPCAIETSCGRIRLLAYPELVSPRGEYYEREEAQKRASAFVEATRFEDRTPAQIGDIRESLLGEETERLEKHWRRKAVDDLRSYRCEAKFVAPGDDVCVFGRYSASSKAIVSDKSAPSLVRGSKLEIEAALDVRILYRLALGATLLVLGTTGISFVPKWLSS